MDPSASYTVIVDDDDPRIVRDANWNIDLARVEDAHCHLYLNSGKRTSTSGSKFAFQFNGTAVEVHGGVAVNSKPSLLSCTVDGNAIESLAQPTVGHSKADSVLCGAQNLDGTKSHTLEVTLQEANAVLDLDYILYQTPLDKLRDGDTLYYHSARTDAINYTSQWTETAQNTHFTATDMSVANFTYYGTGVNVFTIGHDAQGRSRGELYIDDDTGASFSSKSASTDGCSFFSLYKGGMAPKGAEHFVLLSYRGSSRTTDNTPLELNFITLLAQIPSSNSSGNSTTSALPPSQSQIDSPQSPSPRERLSAGAIAGIIVGVVLGLICLLAAAFLFWRRRRTRVQDRAGPPADPFVGRTKSKRRLEKGLEMSQMPARESQDHMLQPDSPIRDGQFHWVAKQVRSLNERQDSMSDNHAEAAHSETEPERVLIHSDSGVRLGNGEGSSRVVEMPPLYTEH